MYIYISIYISHHPPHHHQDFYGFPSDKDVASGCGQERKLPRLLLLCLDLESSNISLPRIESLKYFFLKYWPRIFSRASTLSGLGIFKYHSYYKKSSIIILPTKNHTWWLFISLSKIRLNNFSRVQFSTRKLKRWSPF